jgi:rubrerythrin
MIKGEAMGVRFSADEIFQMAERIEINGAKFYRRAAGLNAAADFKKTLLDLADMEEQHRRIFAVMRQELTEREKEPAIFDTEGQLRDYLRAMADGYVFDVNADLSKLLTGRESMEEIINKALVFEKDSIVFYLGIRDMVSERLGRNRVDDIIREEMNHISILNKELSSRRG